MRASHEATAIGRIRPFVTSIYFLAAAACGAGPGAVRPATTKGDVPAGTSPARDEPAKGAAGGAIRARAGAIDGCEADPAAVKDSSIGPFDACDAWSEWVSKLDASKGPESIAAFFELLGSSSEKQRYAAAYALLSNDIGDKASLEKLVAAAEREKSPLVGNPLARAIDAEKAAEHGLGDRVLAMARAHENKAVRIGLAERLFQIEGSGAVLLDFMADADPEVRKAGVEGLWMIGGDVSCPAWQKALGDADLDVAFAAAGKIAFGDCIDLADEALAWTEKTVAKHPEHGVDAAIVAADACRTTKPKPVVAKATALARKLTAASFPSEVRVKAVSALHDCAPDDKLFAKLAKDRDEAVQREAARSAK
jgi:hypothetical protein